MEKAIATVLPVAFLAQLLVSRAVLTARSAAFGGQPPIDRLPFLASKYLAVAIWAAVGLRSWGLGWRPFALSAPLWLSGSLWIAGFALLFLGRSCLGAQLRIGLPGESTHLCKGGVYGLSRNPMYAGIDATIVAAVLYTGNPAILAAGAFVVAVHHRIIVAEERWLLHAFGGEYERYHDRVGRYATLPLVLRRGARAATALWTLLRMGHCAPAVMSTLVKQDWVIKLAAGLPGGVGNTGGECGGITSPLVMLGLRHGLDQGGRGLPLVVEQGHDHVARFRRCPGALSCREIRGNPPRLLPCVRAVMHSASLVPAVLREPRCVLDGETLAAYRALGAAFAASGFHCAQSVLRRLDGLVAPGRQAQLLAAAGAFVGGTLFLGLTCSAFTAGVMAIGLRMGEIETSRLRVLRMIALMLTGRPAFDDGVNRFNRAINRGNELAAWFAAEVGSTRCRAITGADFSSLADVQVYVASGGIDRCGAIVEKVAARVRLMVRHAGTCRRSV
jgi:protein-S-isoprenylcysteine O-methyltransferase Ste14